jgi:lysophospholipase L1-like esterase
MQRSEGARAPWALAGLIAVCVAVAASAALLRAGSAAPRRIRFADDGEERVVVLGDSVATAAGCGCRPFGPRLATLLAGRLHRAVHVSTLAKDGLTTAGLVAQVQSDSDTKRELRTASAVTVTIAANDFDAGQAQASCADGGSAAACYDSGLAALQPLLSRLLQTVRGLTGPQAQLLVTGYWNVFLDGAVGASQGAAYERASDALTRRVNDELRTAAAAVGATYVDLYRAFRGGGTDDDTPLLAADGDHPSDAGQQRIAQLLAGALTQATVMPSPPGG